MTLRDSWLATPIATPEDLDALAASGMGSLRRGYESGRLTNEANYNLANLANLRAAGDPAAAGLRAETDALRRRASVYAPQVGRVEDIHGVGDAGSYVLGQLGQMPASMQDPIAASALVTSAGTALQFVPNPVAKLVGTGLRTVGAPLAAYGLNQRQLTGEGYGDMLEDPAIANQDPTLLRDRANLYGAGAAVLDTAVPGIVGRQLGGGALRSAAKPLMRPGMRAGAVLLGEGPTETAQEYGKQQVLGDLNPNRDTSGDASALLNSFVGGMIGSTGPVLAGHAAQAAFQGLGRAGERASQAAGTVRELGGQAIDAVQDFKGVRDLRANLRAASQSKNDTSLDDADLIMGNPPEGVADDPVKYKEWAVKTTPQRTDRIVRGLEELAAQGDEKAYDLHQALAAASDNPEASRTALEDAADHLVDRLKLDELAQQAEAASTKRGGLWGLFGRKQNRQGADWTGDEYEASRHAAMNAFDEAAAAEPGRQRSLRRAQLMGEYLAAQTEPQITRYKGSRVKGDQVSAFMRDIGERIGDLADSWGLTGKQEPAADKKGQQFDNLKLNLASTVRSLSAAYGPDAPRVLGELRKMADPKAAPLFDYLDEELTTSQSKVGPRQAAKLRDETFDRVLKAVPPEQQTALLQDGIDLRAPGTRSEIMKLVASAADGTMPPAGRRQLERLLGGEAVQALVDAHRPMTESQSAVEQAFAEHKGALVRDEDGNLIESEHSAMEDPGEGTTAFDQRQGQKSVEARRGAALYALQGLKPLPDRSLSGKPSDPLRFSKTHRPRLFDLRTTAEQDSAAKPEDLAQRKGMIEKYKEALARHLGSDASWDITERSALEDMAQREGVALQTALGPHARNVTASEADARVDEVTARRKTAGEEFKRRIEGLLPKKLLDELMDGVDQPVTGKSRKNADPDNVSERLGVNAPFITKVISRYQQFMRDEAERAANSDKPEAQARQRAFAARALAADTVLKDRLRQSRKGVHAKLETTPEQRELILQKAIAYLSNFGVVVAERQTNRDPERISADQVLTMAKQGRALHDAKGEDVKEDKNGLLMFKSALATKDGKPAAMYIKARDLVRFARTALRDQGQNEKAGNANVQYLRDLSTGIAALVDSGHVEGLPLGFAEGKIPDNLPLATTTYGKWAWGKEQRVKEAAARMKAKGPDGPGDARESGQNQERVAGEQAADIFVPDDSPDKKDERVLDEARGHIIESRAQGYQATAAPDAKLAAGMRSTKEAAFAAELAALIERRTKMVKSGIASTDQRVADINKEITQLKERGPGYYGQAEGTAKRELNAESDKALKIAKLSARRANLLKEGVDEGAQSIRRIDAMLARLEETKPEPKGPDDSRFLEDWNKTRYHEQRPDTGPPANGPKIDPSQRLTKADYEQFLRDADTRIAELRTQQREEVSLPASWHKNADREGYSAKELLKAARKDREALVETITKLAAAKEDAAPAGKTSRLPTGEPDWSGSGRKLNAQAIALHNELKRPGFGAAHNSPIKHEGKFDWRKHLGKGEGNWVYGAGTYLSTADNVHRYYKAQFKGPTYSVSADIAPERVMDWNTPLSEQPASIRLRAMKAIKDNQLDEYAATYKGIPVDMSMTGEELYKGLAEKLGSAEKTSDYLQSLGILGHKYVGGSRGEGHNYVIYDDSKIHTNFVTFNKQQATGQPATPEQIAEAKAYVEKVLGQQVKIDFKNITGYSGEWIEATNTIEISTTSAAGTLQTAYHESLHAFFSKFIKNDPRAFETLKALAEDQELLARAHALLDGYPAAQAQLLASGEERLAYMYQFWAAGLLDLPTKKAGLFEALRRFFRQVLGKITDSERAAAIFQAFHEGKLSEPSTAGKVIAKALNEGTWTTRQLRKMDGVVSLLQNVLPAHSLLMDSDSKTAQDIGRSFWTNPGDEKQGDDGEGYINARGRTATKYVNLFADAIKGLSDRDMRDLATYLQGEKDPADIPFKPVAAAAAKIYALNQRFFKYMKEERGVDIGSVSTRYYPRVWDAGQLLAKQDEFIAMLLARYDAELQAGVTASGGKMSKEAVAQRIHAKLVSNSVGEHILPSRDDGVLAPFFSSAEVREMKWLKGEDAAPFLSKDLISTMTGYFHAGARMAEYTARFGPKGELLDSQLQQVNNELLEAAKKRLGKGEFKSLDEAQAWASRRMASIHKAVGAMEGTLGRDIGSGWRNANAWMTVYQNLRLLPMALFSSVVDPLGLVARGAPMKEAYDAFLRGMKEVGADWADMVKGEHKERQRDKWDDLARAVGTVDAAIFSNHAANEYASMYMSKKAKHVNDTFFRLNGMEAWNRGMRAGATKSAVMFLERHAKNPGDHSVRWLKELGLTAADLTFDSAGDLVTDKRVLMAQKGISASEAERQIEKVHYAISRWVQGAVLTPNAAQRPSWASDPHYSMFFHLKQFSYSFHQTVLKRAVNELNYGNLAPMGAFAWYIPVMIASDITKGLMQGGGTLPAHMQGMNAGDWLLHGAERAGMLGIGNIGVDASHDIWSIGGPAVEQVINAFTDPIGRTVVDALPAHGLYAEALR